MPPVIIKKTWKEVNAERKSQRKKWKEQKLLKTAGFKKGIEDLENNAKEHQESNFNGNDDANKLVLSSSQSINSLLTVSIAVPGSILSNAQSAELRTYLAGQIARAACIYKVDEIIVFDDVGNANEGLLPNTVANDCFHLARTLQYLECPQYLRKHIFPMHRDLQYAGVLNPLDAPHHLRQTEDFPFREGIVTSHSKKEKGSYVNVGLLKEVCIDKHLIPGIRVTVRLLPSKGNSKKKHGVVVSPSTPKQELGVYWGYTVRIANSLSDVFAKCPYEEGYDFTIGTSDKGEPINSCNDCDFSSVKHVLIAFGGLQGLEAALENDETLEINDVSLLFDKYLNTCVGQGSRTIRTEEAILISLAQLVDKFSPFHNTSKDP
uniref:Uncharacterized protein n=1 Tax=Clastoptera arizonana TaxID=38151 RepID=A0A1B6DRB7_9HEMI